MGRSTTATRFKLQPADPFDLIRWLARTQNDPRKAVAELVQNSIDACARTVRIERRRIRGAPALVIRDDGEGVLPAMEREQALRYLGTNIGHSHKLGLSALERHARVVAGQYGVGLLGFWALGRRLELRSRVGGSEVHVLALEEDKPTAHLGRAPRELDAPPTFTELVIHEVHEGALRPLAGRRLADYLAAELRGPILQAGVIIEIHDHLARGLAQKVFPVTPRRFEGLRLAVPAELEVPDHAAIRIELYLSRGADRQAVQLACAGTLVAGDFAELEVLGLARPPWVGCELTGLVDFPGFQVPPGTRRGVTPNAAALAFARALEGLEPAIVAELDRHERGRRAEADRHVVEELRKALRGLHERMPHYDLPMIDRGTEPDGASAEGVAVTETPEAAADELASHELGPQPPLFPPGPLAGVAIVPATVELAAGAERRIHARCVDADGRVIRAALEFTWVIEGDGFALAGEGSRPAVRASGDLLVGARAIVTVVAREAERTATATAVVTVAEPRPRDRGGAGIPNPELVDAPGASWRSRMEEGRWQVNAGHEDYAALGDGRSRLRYLIALLGKEIVVRTYGQPGAGELLEHLIAVTAHAERNLRG
jgi:Histidine kinase-, DNA gyrase B-, and HSP90-like ATPase